MKNKIFKTILFLVILFFAITALGLWGPKVASYWKEYQYNIEIKRAVDMAKATERAYMNDRDGGKTPEETLDLLITALKAGNTLQASKYYELSVQPKALASLQSELVQHGNLQKSIDYFTEVREKGEKKCNEEGDGCTFRYRGVIDGYNRIIDLNKNYYSLIWKITQPF